MCIIDYLALQLVGLVICKKSLLRMTGRIGLFVVDNSDVVVLFPEDGVSAIQKAQLTSFDGPRACAIGMMKACISFFMS